MEEGRRGCRQLEGHHQAAAQAVVACLEKHRAVHHCEGGEEEHAAAVHLLPRRGVLAGAQPRRHQHRHHNSRRQLVFAGAPLALLSIKLPPQLGCGWRAPDPRLPLLTLCCVAQCARRGWLHPVSVGGDAGSPTGQLGQRFTKNWPCGPGPEQEARTTPLHLSPNGPAPQTR